MYFAMTRRYIITYAKPLADTWPEKLPITVSSVAVKKLSLHRHSFFAWVQYV